MTTRPYDPWDEFAKYLDEWFEETLGGPLDYRIREDIIENLMDQVPPNDIAAAKKIWADEAYKQAGIASNAGFRGGEFTEQLRRRLTEKFAYTPETRTPLLELPPGNDLFRKLEDIIDDPEFVRKFGAVQQQAKRSKQLSFLDEGQLYPPFMGKSGKPFLWQSLSEGQKAGFYDAATGQWHPPDPGDFGTGARIGHREEVVNHFISSLGDLKANVDAGMGKEAYTDFVDKMLAGGVDPEDLIDLEFKLEAAWDQTTRNLRIQEEFASGLQAAGWKKPDIVEFLDEFNAEGVFDVLPYEGGLDDLLDGLMKTQSYDEWKYVQNMPWEDSQIFKNINWNLELVDRYGPDAAALYELGEENFNAIGDALQKGRNKAYEQEVAQKNYFRSFDETPPDPFINSLDDLVPKHKLDQINKFQDDNVMEFLGKITDPIEDGTELIRKPGKDFKFVTFEDFGLEKGDWDGLMKKLEKKAPSRLARFGLMAGLFADLATTVTSDTPVIRERWEKEADDRIAAGMPENMAWLDILMQSLDKKNSTSFAPAKTLEGQWERAIFGRVLDSTPEQVVPYDKNLNLRGKTIPEIGFESWREEETQVGQFNRMATMQAMIQGKQTGFSIDPQGQATGDPYAGAGGSTLRSRVPVERGRGPAKTGGFFA